MTPGTLAVGRMKGADGARIQKTAQACQASAGRHHSGSARLEHLWFGNITFTTPNAAIGRTACSGCRGCHHLVEWTAHIRWRGTDCVGVGASPSPQTKARTTV